ncbi:tail fiber assembly protein [Pseudomonas sp. ANT_H12B]|uniref:tail fiber assembly protein n=1 Tax=Pseudomonas sp. ANT_H12B TaxID=2597348 RepID=UPI0015B5A867|nr:tail fiber assembly protein [Pseudomonas sp. ANT_H12B]
MTTYYYSAATSGFYNSDDHSELPGDVVEIGKELLDQLVLGNSTGLIIVPDGKGLPICVSRESLMSDDDLAGTIRQRRDSLLAESDWVSLRANETGKAVPATWLAYRTALRDLPSQAGWPRNIEWPTAPST